MDAYNLHSGHYAVLRFLGSGWQKGVPNARPHKIQGVNRKWVPALKRWGLVTWDGTHGELTPAGMEVLTQHRGNAPKDEL